MKNSQPGPSISLIPERLGTGSLSLGVGGFSKRYYLLLLGMLLAVSQLVVAKSDILKKTEVKLTNNSEFDYVRLFVDGKSLCTAPRGDWCVEEVTVGSHRISAQTLNGGYAIPERSVKIGKKGAGITVLRNGRIQLKGAGGTHATPIVLGVLTAVGVGAGAATQLQTSSSGGTLSGHCDGTAPANACGACTCAAGSCSSSPQCGGGNCFTSSTTAPFCH